MTPRDPWRPKSKDTTSLDEVIANAMCKLRSASPPLAPEALEVIERVEAEIADRQRERLATDMARWLDENPRTDDDQAP